MMRFDQLRIVRRNPYSMVEVANGVVPLYPDLNFLASYSDVYTMWSWVLLNTVASFDVNPASTVLRPVAGPSIHAIQLPLRLDIARHAFPELYSHLLELDPAYLAGFGLALNLPAGQLEYIGAMVGTTVLHVVTMPSQAGSTMYRQSISYLPGGEATQLSDPHMFLRTYNIFDRPGDPQFGQLTYTFPNLNLI
jgi:hypothetical protein